MKADIITQLEGLLANTDISAVATQVKHLQRDYEQAFSKEMEKAKQEFIDDGGKTRDFIYSKTAEDTRIIELFEQFRKLKKQQDEKIANEQQKNFDAKQMIIADINDLSKMEVNVGIAMKKLNELQARWKEIGAVSPHKYKEQQSEYSKAVESFYYNLNIYRALQEHDLKRNYELKTDILARIKSLESNKTIKEVEQLIKTYRNDWEETGPVPQEKWEEMKTEYRSALELVYGKIKAHYKAIEEKRENSLSAKKSLLEKASALVEQMPGNEEEWKKKTDELIALQNEYKSAGRTEQKAGDEVWNAFRGVCDLFFEKKKEFYSGIKEKYAETKKKKIELIEKAEALGESKEWKETSDKLIKLQDAWKKLPGAGNDEQKLFFRFRKACNAFFEAKRAHFEVQDAGFENNLKVKEEILARIQAYVPAGDDQGDREALRRFSEEWNAAGMVPFKEKQRVNEAFYHKLDELYESLNINKEEKALIKFRNKLERFVHSDNAETLLKKEHDHLKKQIDEINSSIRTYENNLGFFKSAKGKSDFMIEAENKIAAEKEKIDDFKKKQKIISEALNSLQKV
ncbi:MAG: DUF349 domain-containing protein [Bacteroidia bacterium]